MPPLPLSPLAGLGLILLSTLATAIYFVAIARLMRTQPGVSSNFFLCLTNYAAALIALPLWLALRQSGHSMLPDVAGWSAFLLAALFLLLSRELYFYAYSRVDIAQITVFSALTPIYTLLTGYWFLHELPSGRVLCGIVIVTFSIYSIFLPVKGEATGILQPFRRMARSWPVLCGFLSTIPTAFGTICQKKALFGMDIVSFSLCLFITIGTAALLIELGRKERCLRPGLALLKRPSFWGIGALLVVTHVAFAPLLLAYHSAVALTLQRCSIVFQIVLAYFFLDQKEDMRRRLMASLMILLGLALLWHPASG